MITADVVALIAPNCDALVWAPALAAAAAEFEINTSLRAAHWLAQVAHESAGLTRLAENLNYAPAGLIATFGLKRISQADADRFGRTQAHTADQMGIANTVYGGAWGLKNLGNDPERGDGYAYRGRGPLQTTGRANYRKTGARLGIDLEASPGRLVEPAIGARAAGAFWLDHGLNALADTDDLEAITRKINGGLLGLDRRRYLLGIARAALAEPVT